MSDRTIEDLRYLQALPLEMKVEMTKARIREWVAHYGVNGVYVSFSGGKDSTVLLHIAREMYPDIPACFVDTGLEYPEIKAFVRTFENVDIIRPKKTFRQVICEYGYPMITKKVSQFIGNAQRGVKYALDYVNLEGSAVRDGKISKWNVNRYKDLLNADFRINNKCCDVMKKKPAFTYQRENQRKPLTAQMAAESEQREHNWLRFGCNMFDAKHPISNPMSFWTEQDVLQYIRENNIKIASAYGDIVYQDADGQQRFDGCGKLCTTGCNRTGCIFCGFGSHLEKGEGRFERLHRTHPKLYDYCMNGGAYDDNGIWKPDSKGLGMKHVIDELNKLYGESFIKY